MRREAAQARLSAPEVVVYVEGREVLPRPVSALVVEQIEAALLDSVRRDVQSRLAGLRCAVHKTLPAVRADGPSFTRLQYSVTGCCPTLIAAARRQLQQTPVQPRSDAGRGSGNAAGGTA
jgi:hypothetical protein